MTILGIDDLGEAEQAVKGFRPRRHWQRHLVEPCAGPEIEPHALMPHRPVPAAEAWRIVERKAHELARAGDGGLQRIAIG